MKRKKPLALKKKKAKTSLVQTTAELIKHRVFIVQYFGWPERNDVINNDAKS